MVVRRNLVVGALLVFLEMAMLSASLVVDLRPPKTYALEMGLLNIVLGFILPRAEMGKLSRALSSILGLGAGLLPLAEFARWATGLALLRPVGLVGAWCGLLGAAFLVFYPPK